MSALLQEAARYRSRETAVLAASSADYAHPERLARPSERGRNGCEENAGRERAL
jgi:hypothetical protein